MQVRRSAHATFAHIPAKLPMFKLTSLCMLPVQGIMYSPKKRDSEEIVEPSEESQPLFAEPTTLHST